ncbi:MAG TPA: helix-hairpin-helix domain-containing protein, partial [Dissulfurispiraceae bacterium]
HGAESDYYMSLPNPYKAKNADFDTLEELLLVKGVTPELLYGSKGKKGIIDFLTVNSRSNMINVNYAPREVLTAIPGISADIADSIIEYRNGSAIKSIEELQGLLGDSYTVASPYLTIADASTFTIESVGRKSNGRAGYHIKATVVIDSNNKYRYLYYKSPVYVKS